MKKYKLFRDNFLTAVLLLCAILFTSCINSLIDDSETTAGDCSKYVILEGDINSHNLQEPENGARYAYPTISEIPSGTPYYYKATVKNALTNGGTGEGSFSSWADAKYSVKVPYGTWTEIIVELYKDANYINKIFEGTKTINLVVDENSPSSILEEVFVKPVNDNSVEGNIELTIYNKTTATIYAKMIYNGPGFTAPDAITILSVNSANFIINNVVPGSYDVTINFYKKSECTDIPCYSCVETINVYSELTTNLWGGNSDTSPHLQVQEDSTVQFVLTQELLDKFVNTTICVGTSTDGTGNGSYFNPFEQLSDAINACTSTTDYYRIYLLKNIQISGDVTISKNINILTLGNDKKEIKGYGGPFTFELNSGKTVSFINLQIKDIEIYNNGQNCRFSKCDLENITITTGNFKNCNFDSCTMINTTIDSSGSCSLNNCTIDNGEDITTISIKPNKILYLSGKCKITGKVKLLSEIVSSTMSYGKISFSGSIVSAPEGDSDGIVATIVTDATEIKNIFSGIDETSLSTNFLTSLNNFNFLPQVYTSTTPTRQFVNIKKPSENNKAENYELFVVRYVADGNASTNGLGVAGADGGKGTKLKPYNDVFNAADSFDNDPNTGYNGQTANAIDNYKYLIYIAGTVGVNNGNPNRDIVFGSSGITASYYLRGYDSSKTNMIKRYNGGNRTTNRNLFTITGSKIDVHVDNLSFDDSFENNTIFPASEKNCFYIQSGADTSNKNSLELNNVTIKKHKVSGEGYAIKAEENTILKLNNVNISSCQGNPGGAIYYAGSDNIEIKGKILINDNKSGPSTSLKNSNICLYNESAKIKITDTLDTASRIGISNRIPTKANPKIVFTNGFSTNTPSGTAPTTIFSSDEDYIICQDNNEVAVAGVTYGSIKPKLKDDIVLVANGTSFITGQANTVEIVPKINGIKIEDDKLSDWAFELYFYGNKIELDNQTSGLPYSNDNTLFFPEGTPAEGLSVFAKVKYNGTYYSTDVKLTDDNIVNKPEDYEPVSDDVIYVSNQEGWDKIVNWVNDGKSLVGVDVIITNDFTLSNARTVGKADKIFKGEIYGQQHTITLASVDTSYSALVFKYDNSSGHIDGITIAGPESGFNFNTANQDKYYGIVRILTSGYVSNCINRCSVSSSSSQGSLSGIVGYCIGQSNKNILNCKNFGNFTNTTPGDSSNYYYVGGILAYSNNCKITIMNCINEGNLTGYIVGGIAGSNEGGEEINSCINKGNVTGPNSGGIAGYGSGKITKCKNTGTIMTETAAVSNVGGIIGYVIANITIDNCLNDGNVGWNSTANTNFYTGGIVGILPATSGSSYDIKYNCNLMEPDNSVINNSIKWFSGVIGRLFTISGSPTINIANNIYYKSTKTYYGTSYINQNEDESEYFAFNNENINNALEKLKDASNLDKDVWTITYKNGKPQLDLNIFIEE